MVAVFDEMPTLYDIAQSLVRNVPNLDVPAEALATVLQDEGIDKALRRAADGLFKDQTKAHQWASIEKKSMDGTMMFSFQWIPDPERRPNLSGSPN